MQILVLAGLRRQRLMIYWPAELDQAPLQEGFSRGFADARLRTQTDAGPPKVRRRSARAVKPLAVSFWGSYDEMARLERFWDEDTSGGVRPFALPNPMRDGRALAGSDGRLLLDGQDRPIIITSYDLVTFGESRPTISPMGGHNYRASFSLLVMP